MSNQTIRTRADIETKYLWNAESVFATREDWQSELSAVTTALPDLARFTGKLGSSPDWWLTFWN